MSVDFINHKLTTSTTDENGVITWSNPAVNVTINSKGEVMKDGEYVDGYYDRGRINTKQYYVTFKKGCVTTNSCPSFKTLFSRMVLGVKLGASKTFILKDDEKGYFEDNINFINVGSLQNSVVKPNNIGKYNRAISLKKEGLTHVEISRVVGVSLSTVDRWVKIFKDTQPNIVHDQTQTLLLNTQISQSTTQPEEVMFYTLHEAKNEHITEDGAIFPTKELAEWHQTKVSKGKGNAQVVLDYNGGYVLAEQIYLQEVVYNKSKPYTNFIDVLNNNQGIVSVVQEEHCVFDKIDVEGFEMLTNFKMDGVYNLITSKFKAVKIQEALEQYSNSYLAFDESAKHLDKLIKESV